MSVRERKEQKKRIKRSCFCTQFCQKTKPGYNWGSMLHIHNSILLHCWTLRAGGCSLAFGHAELWDLLPPGQILCMFCPDANSESCNRVTPKIIIHVQISVGDKWILGESSQNCKQFFWGGLSQVMLGFSMELRTVPAPIVLSSIKLENSE